MASELLSGIELLAGVLSPSWLLESFLWIIIVAVHVWPVALVLLVALSLLSRAYRLLEAAHLVAGSIAGVERNHLHNALEEQGMRVRKTVSRNTDCLIVGVNPGLSKVKAARQALLYSAPGVAKLRLDVRAFSPQSRRARARVPLRS